MNQLIIVLSLLLGAHTLFASTPASDNEQSCSSIQLISALANFENSFHKGVIMDG
jgi:hypothetical protein